MRATCGQRRRPVWATACRPGNQKPRPGAWTGVSWALSRSLQSMVRSGAKGGISRLLLTIAPVTSAPRLGNSLPPWEPKTTTGCLDLSFLGPAQVPTIDGSPRSEGEHFKVTSDHCPGRRAPGWAFYFPAQGAHFKTMRTLRDLESHGRCAPPPERGNDHGTPPNFAILQQTHEKCPGLLWWAAVGAKIARGAGRCQKQHQRLAQRPSEKCKETCVRRVIPWCCGG